MRRLLSAILVASASSLAWFACGGSTSSGASGYSGPPEDAPALSLDEYCGQFAAIGCDFADRCCGRSIPGCGDQAKKYCLDNTHPADPSLQWDPVAAGVCTANERRLFAGCTLDTSVTASSISCGQLFDHGVAPGGPCKASTDCAYQRHAMVSCSAGSCVAQSIVGLGAPCGPSSHASCDLDLRCSIASSGDGGADSATCIAAPAEGESCATGYGCRHDLYCDATSHLCTRRLADGAACTTSDTCTSFRCTSGHCASTSLCGTATP